MIPLKGEGICLKPGSIPSSSKFHITMKVRHLSRGSRGAGIASALIVAALILTLGFTVAGVSFHHLNVSTRISNAQIAQDLAESALAKTIERIQERESSTKRLDFGADGSETVTVHLEMAPEGSRGVVSFDKSYLEAQNFGLERSVNNLASDFSIPADDGRQVPGEAVYLVGYGVCNGVERRVETIVHIPRFPYSVASHGSIRGTDLFVASLKEGSELPSGGPPDPENLLPGNLVTNSEGGDSALVFEGDNVIKGDLQSASGVDLSGGTTKVEGETRTFAGKVELPKLDVSSYAPNPSDPATRVGLSSVENRLEINSRTLYDNPSTPLIVTNGLTLNGGLLYVNGDLTVTGGITGKGAVVATGKIDLSGAGRLSSDNLTALLAGGDITIDGGTGSPDSAIFEGLIYTEGNLKAQNLTLIGVFVANNEGAEQTELKNVKVYEKSEHSRLSFESTVTTPGQQTPSSTGGGGFEAPEPEFGNEANGRQNFIFKAKLDGPPPIDGTIYSSPRSLVDAFLAMNGAPQLSPAERTALENTLDFLARRNFRVPTGGLAVNAPPLVLLVSDMEGFVSQVRGLDSTTPEGWSESTPVNTFSLDLSEFLSVSDRMRILYWGAAQ